MAQLPLEPVCRACEMAWLRRASMAAGLLAMCLLLITGCSGKGSQPAAKAVDPQAQADAKARADAEAQARADAKARAEMIARQREQMKRDAIALNKQHDSLKQQASASERKARSLRAQAMPIEREGQTNIAAGEQLCDAGDCEGGCAVIARGEAKVAKANEMRAEAERLESNAIAMRQEADEIAMQARDLLASMPTN